MNEQSLEEKLIEMNRLGFVLSELQSGEKYAALSREEKDTIWLVADGMAEEWVMRHVEGRVSLQAMIDTSMEDVEGYVDEKTEALKAIAAKVMVEEQSHGR